MQRDLPIDQPEDGQVKPKSNRGFRGRGFRSMSPERRREIASKGGKAAHAAGKAHVFTHEEAVAAGRKGGSAYSKRNVSRYSRMSTEELDKLIEKHDKTIEEQEYE